VFSIQQSQMIQEKVDTVYILFLHEPVSENLQIKMDYVRKMQSSREKNIL
jgi:hypothetical protein